MRLGSVSLEFPTELHAADFDLDGRLDLIAGDFLASTLFWYRGDGSGTFEDGVAIDAGGAVKHAAAGDVDGDGRPDLVTVNAKGSVSVIVNRERCLPERRRAVRH